MNFIRDLDTPLLQLAAATRDHFTLRDACDGVHIFGGIGSGKTSGSGKALREAYLRAGMGGIVLCAKPEEVELWLTSAKANGRAQSVLVFDERHGFNFINWELARHGADGIGNVIEFMMRIFEAADLVTGAAGTSSDPFWPQTVRQVIIYTVQAIYAAYGSVTIDGIVDFVSSAGTSPQQYTNKEWSAHSFAAQTLRKAANQPAVPMRDAHSVQALAGYWLQQFPAVPEKTRGNILISVTTRLDRFRHGRLRRAFADRTTIVPELTFHGAIIILAMPALTWNDDGIIGQQLFKYAWQRAVESRNGLDPVHRERPVFLWADEAQYFVSSKDDDFLSTCRGSRACPVYLTQTLPTYYAKLGKDKTDAADGLVGKFNTQIFHQNACTRTNTFASQLIGRSVQLRHSTNQSVGTNKSRGMNEGTNSSHGSTYSSGSSSGSGGGGSNSSSGSSHSSGESTGRNIGHGSNESQSWGSSEQMDNIIEPRVFASELKSGGPKHNYEVTAVWFKTGARFATSHGANFLFPTFKQ